MGCLALGAGRRQLCAVHGRLGGGRAQAGGVEGPLRRRRRRVEGRHFLAETGGLRLRAPPAIFSVGVRLTYACSMSLTRLDYLCDSCLNLSHGRM